VFGIGTKQWHSKKKSSNDLKFDMFVYYTCVDFWKKFKNGFSFISFEQSMKKNIHFKVWYLTKFGVIFI
jgi:hypothetical protein